MPISPGYGMMRASLPAREPRSEPGLELNEGKRAIMVSLLRIDLVLLAGIGLGVLAPWIAQLPWRKRLLVFAVCGATVLAGSFV